MKQSTVTDMTVGSPLGHLVRFTIPLLIGNLFQQVYNLVDSLVVGNYVGAGALAAVGTCGSLNFLFFSLTSGLAIGMGILAAQAFGARDEKLLRETISSAAWILVLSSLFVTVIGCFAARPLLKLLQVPDSVLDDAQTYLVVTTLGTLAVAFYNGVSAILRALGDSKTPLYFLILASIVNVVLDLLFVLKFHWDVFGVGMATILSQIASCVGSLIYAFLKVPYFRMSREEWKPQKRVVLRSLKIGIPMALQNSIISISTMVLQGVVNSFGEDIMAAYTVIGRVEQLVQQPYSSLGTALTSYAGQNVGACKLRRVRQGFQVSVYMALIFSLALLPVCFFFGNGIIGLFVKDADVIQIGARGLMIDSLFYFSLGMIYVPRSLLNGCGDSAFAMINGTTEVICRILFSQLLTRIAVVGYWGIFITNGLTWTVTALVCIHRYRFGSWRKLDSSGDTETVPA